MKFWLKYFVPNAVDVTRIGALRLDRALLTSEFLCFHRVSERLPLLDLFPKGGVGAELGVFTGLFSDALLRQTAARKIYFVDPWWKAYGPTYPDWGHYTGGGSLKTSRAHDVAAQRIKKYNSGTLAEIVVGFSNDFLSSVPDDYFDWVYVDSTHSYEGTLGELKALQPKMRIGGIVAGDDWHDDPAHDHAGVALAVREALRDCKYASIEDLPPLPPLQWAIRRSA